MKQRVPIKRSPLPRPTLEQAIAWETRQRELARKRGQIKTRAKIRTLGRRGKREQQALDKGRAVVISRSGGFCEGPPVEGVHPSRAHGANHVHHVLSRGRGGSHDPSNLLHLCGSLHRWLHENPSEASDLGLLESRASGYLLPPNRRLRKTNEQ